MNDRLISKTFGTAKLVAKLGAGGMGTVYRGYQQSIERWVAVKLLPADLLRDRGFLSRFSLEARALAQLNHPAILPLYEYGEANGVPYIVMPIMAGGSFKDRVEKGPLPLSEVLRVLTPIADALHYAHERGFLHRDVKPSNILFDERDNPVLADFGLARVMRSAQETHRVSGTPAYMSPEQGRGESLDRRTDLYSLGVVVYEALVGRLPFIAATPTQLILLHYSAAPTPPRELNPDVPKAVEEVVLKSLAKKPDDRYSTPTEFIEALSNAAYLSRGFWRPRAAQAEHEATSSAPTMVSPDLPPKYERATLPPSGLPKAPGGYQSDQTEIMHLPEEFRFEGPYDDSAPAPSPKPVNAHNEPASQRPSSPSAKSATKRVSPRRSKSARSSKPIKSVKARKLAKSGRSPRPTRSAKASRRSRPARSFKSAKSVRPSKPGKSRSVRLSKSSKSRRKPGARRVR